MINNLKNKVRKSTLRSLYYSFIYPYLDYNIINWSNAPKTTLNCLRKSNRKAIKTILSANNNAHFPPLFKELEILPLNELIKYRRGTYMYKLTKNLLPASAHNWFKKNNSNASVRLNRFYIPNPRTEYAKRNHTYGSTKL